MRIDLKLELEFGHCNGAMTVLVKDKLTNAVLLEVANPEENIVSSDLEVPFPCNLVIEVSGKNMNTDTQVNEAGQVIADKFVKVSKMHVGRIPVLEKNLFALCNYHKEDGTTANDTYWGWNGTIDLDFNQSSVIMWHAIHNQGMTIY
jgi:hypothetical protein